MTSILPKRLRVHMPVVLLNDFLQGMPHDESASAAETWQMIAALSADVPSLTIVSPDQLSAETIIALLDWGCALEQLTELYFRDQIGSALTNCRPFLHRELFLGACLTDNLHLVTHLYRHLTFDRKDEYDMMNRLSRGNAKKACVWLHEHHTFSEHGGMRYKEIIHAAANNSLVFLRTFEEKRPRKLSAHQLTKALTHTFINNRPAIAKWLITAYHRVVYYHQNDWPLHLASPDMIYTLLQTEMTIYEWDELSYNRDRILRLCELGCITFMLPSILETLDGNFTAHRTIFRVAISADAYHTVAYLLAVSPTSFIKADNTIADVIRTEAMARYLAERKLLPENCFGYGPVWMMMGGTVSPEHVRVLDVFIEYGLYNVHIDIYRLLPHISLASMLHIGSVAHRAWPLTMRSCRILFDRNMSHRNTNLVIYAIFRKLSTRYVEYHYMLDETRSACLCLHVGEPWGSIIPEMTSHQTARHCLWISSHIAQILLRTSITSFRDTEIVYRLLYTLQQ